MEQDAVDAVAIGRNEGERLIACLTSLRAAGVRRIVYVDSGSTDGSAAAAAALGAEVVPLDLSRPFTAARARNAGLDRLGPDGADLVQMIDGDCALAPGWLAAGRATLAADPGLTAVCGRRRERFPVASVYNLLCDLEWNTPVGPARACGGDVLIRRAALTAIGGYRPDVIAAEDDEICQRLIAAGGRLARIDAEMTRHDAAMTRFGQWWRRAVRAGHGFAQVGGLHPHYFVAERRRVWLWGAALPGAALAGLAAGWPALPAAAAGLYALSFARGLRRFRHAGLPPRQAAACAGLIVLSKFPNLQGVLTWRLRQLRGRAATIIEYK
ncbi:MAG: glycosyltransferase family 2 protein [Rhodobacterales bacterium]|nr:glycosyltransferase family 2 protein [Rhodobacterales bacterium]